MRATEEPRVWVSVPCKGRLSFLQQTIPSVLAQPGLEYCLVDFSCPDGAGSWLEAAHPQRIRDGRIVVERVSGREEFHKAAAHNVGGCRAARSGATHVCFMDADTKLLPGFSEWLLPRLRSNTFWIAALNERGVEVPGLVGFLVVPAAAFVASGGYDETFVDWGAEDLEYRLRLSLEQGLTTAEVPLELLGSLPHDDALRTQYYREKDTRRSNLRNHALMVHKFRRRGLPLNAQGPEADRLWRRVATARPRVSEQEWRS